MTENRTIHNQFNQCITQQDMIAYVQGTLSAEHMHRVERHVLECDMCADELEGLQLLQNPAEIITIQHTLQGKIKAVVNPPKMKVWYSTRLITIAASVLLLLGVGSVVWLISRNSIQQIHLNEHAVLLDRKDTHYAVLPLTQDSIVLAEFVKKTNPKKPSVSALPIVQENDYQEESFFSSNAPMPMSDLPQSIPSKPSESIGFSPQINMESVEYERAAAPASRQKAMAVSKEVRVDKKITGAKSVQTAVVLNKVQVSEEFRLQPSEIKQVWFSHEEIDIETYGNPQYHNQILFIETINKQVSFINYSKATYSQGDERTFVELVSKKIVSHITAQPQNHVVSVFCSIDSRGVLEVKATSVQNQKALEKTIVRVIQAESGWSPALYQGKAVESVYMFTLNLTQ